MFLSKSLLALLVGGVSAAVPTAPSTPTAARRAERIDAGVMTAFGRSVAIAGEFAFVGEPNVGGGGRGGGRGGAPPAAGVVHIYRYGASVWKLTGSLSSSNAIGGDGFGSAMAAEGATLLVGQVTPAPVPAFAGRGQGGGGGRGTVTVNAPAPPDTAIGSVQLFKRGADMKWTANGRLTATSAAGAQFGSSLALAGDMALVGAPGEPSGGTVYVFQRGADGQWSTAGALPAQGLVGGDRFGSAIAIDGNRVAVGAPNRKGKGAVYIFRRDGGSWTQETEQVAPQNLPDRALFGGAVAVKGDRVIAGAPGTNFSAPPVNAARDSLSSSSIIV